MKISKEVMEHIQGFYELTDHDMKNEETVEFYLQVSLGIVEPSCPYTYCDEDTCRHTQPVINVVIDGDNIEEIEKRHKVKWNDSCYDIFVNHLLAKELGLVVPVKW